MNKENKENKLEIIKAKVNESINLLPEETALCIEAIEFYQNSFAMRSKGGKKGGSAKVKKGFAVTGLNKIKKYKTEEERKAARVASTMKWQAKKKAELENKKNEY